MGGDSVFPMLARQESYDKYFSQVLLLCCRCLGILVVVGFITVRIVA